MRTLKNFIKLSGLNQRYWLNPLFLAIFPAALIIWLQPVQFTPYLFEASSTYDNETIWFEDLENDGAKEKIILGNESETGNAYLIYHNENNQRLNQFNFNHPNAKSRRKIKPYAADFNEDGSKEIIIFTQNEDSLFVNAFDFKKEEACVSNRFITTIGGGNEFIDYTIIHLGHFDANNDSIPEFYFSVTAGFALYPRKIFRYDLANDSLISSLNTGAGHLPGRIGMRKDSMLLMVGSIAHGNIRKNYPYPYHDTTSWIFAFDKDLKLKFPPKSYGINAGGIDCPTFIEDYIYYTIGSNSTQKENKLFKMNWQGELVDSIVFDFYVSKKLEAIQYNNKSYYAFFNDETKDYYYLDTSNFKYICFPNKILNGNNQIYTPQDLNNDGENETFLYSHTKKRFELYNNNFKELDIIIDAQYPRFISSNYFEDEKYGECMFNTEKSVKTYRYYLNSNRYYKYPVGLSIYFLSVLFVASILYFQNRRIQRHQQMEQQLADLQLQNLRNQLDPHFTFNVLNLVGNAIYKQDKEAAYDLFQRFTQIIRSSLMSSDKVFRTLKEELQFTQDYLEFQKLRFKKRFEFSINVEQGIDTQNIQFPKMLVQGFAENAVKHAFYGVDYLGQINILVSQENEKLKVTIEDNGIGIKRSKEHGETSGTQKGLKVLHEQVRQINKIYSASYSLGVKDRVELGLEGNGTLVIIGMV